MVHQGQVVDSTTTRMEFTTTAAESDGALHEMRVTYAAGSEFPPPHLHPAQDERFEVLQGSLLFVVDGVESQVAEGESVEIVRGSVHQARNPGDVPAVTTWQTRPALRTGEFFEALAKARQEGGSHALLRVVEEFSDVYALAEQPAR